MHEEYDMTVFEIPIREIEAESTILDRQLEPDPEYLTELFSDIVDEYKIVDPDEFVIRLQLWCEEGTINVAGQVSGQFSYQCGRCLQDRQLEVDASVDSVLMPEQRYRAEYEVDEEIELDPADLNVSFYSGEILDLAPIVRESVLLELPNYSPCTRETPDRCDEAYEKYVDRGSVEALDSSGIDLRWEPLKDIELDKN
jgi:uncharacterized metal-binding protein YceD (DUF177 family)